MIFKNIGKEIMNAKGKSFVEVDMNLGSVVEDLKRKSKDEIIQAYEKIIDNAKEKMTRQVIMSRASLFNNPVKRGQQAGKETNPLDESDELRRQFKLFQKIETAQKEVELNEDELKLLKENLVGMKKAGLPVIIVGQVIDYLCTGE